MADLKDLGRPVGVIREWHCLFDLTVLELRIVAEAYYYHEKGRGGILYKTQSDLAKKYGVTRIKLCRALKRLKEYDLIVVEGSTITPSKKTIEFSLYQK